MNAWETLAPAIIGSGVGSTVLSGLWAYFNSRRKRKDSLEDSVRKELWTEISNLRVALRDASATLADWQTRYVELLSTHKTTVEQITYNQKNFIMLGGLLNQALKCLDKIEEVERNIDTPDLEEAKTQIAVMKEEAEIIRQKSAVVFQI